MFRRRTDNTWPSKARQININENPALVFVQRLGAYSVAFLFNCIRDRIKLNMSKVEKAENIKQLFEDDPWLQPFEGEIRRR